ncbi:hypothetical protein TRAPUB_4895, partial [Trametes pubescens]
MLQPDIDELIKAMNGLQSIRLVIMVSPRRVPGPPSLADHLAQWPGYPDHVKEVSLRTPDNKQWVTRLGLRGNISRAYEVFFKSMDDFVHFLDMFASLPQLEGPSAFTGEHLRRLLDERLPLRLFALPLTWVFSKVDDAAFLQEWIAMLKKRPSLEYFQVLSFDLQEALDLCYWLLEEPLPSLELIGYNTYMSRIEHDWATGEVVCRPPWKGPTVAFMAADNFGCEHSEWLLRNHDWNGL